MAVTTQVLNLNAVIVLSSFLLKKGKNTAKTCQLYPYSPGLKPVAINAVPTRSSISLPE